MKNKSNLNFYTLVVSLCITFFSFSKVVAQENGIYELNANSSEDRTEFYDLANNLQPTAYVENNTIKIGGNGDHDGLQVVKLTFNDAQSFNILNENTNFGKVELVTIKLLTPADLNNRIDLSEVRGLNRLKYVLIECAFECTPSQIKQFITYQDDSNIRILYKVNKPS